MQKLCDLLASLGNSLDLVDVLSTLDRELRKLVYYDAISVHLAEDARLAPAYAAGYDASRRLGGQEEMDLLIRVAIDRRPAVNEICRGPESLDYSLVFPIENASAVIGILALYRRHAKPFSRDEVDLLKLLSLKLSASIENAQKFQLAADSAATDPATGLANRRWLFQQLDAELARARRAKTGLGVVHCSIGGLQESNRLASPDSARRAFETVTVRIRESCREYDFSARSGDDLVLVLPGFGPADLVKKRELIQRIVEETGLSAGLPLFANVGAAFYPQDGRDTEDLLAEASRRMNMAKRFDSGTEPTGMRS
jgi:diguanylate cyclase (GGDEF)-like protein